MRARMSPVSTLVLGAVPVPSSASNRHNAVLPLISTFVVGSRTLPASAPQTYVWYVPSGGGVQRAVVLQKLMAPGK